MLSADADLEGFLSDSGKKLAITIAVSVLTSFAAFAFGRYYGRWKARREWQSKEFLNRVIVSLNIFSEGTLKIRTVLERSIEEVFLNPIAIEKIQYAVKRCTSESPILPIPKEDRWYLLNFVLNCVAEHFVAGQIRLDAGEKVTVVRYALFLTCEVVGDERIRKCGRCSSAAISSTTSRTSIQCPSSKTPGTKTASKPLRRASALLKTDPDNFLMLETCVQLLVPSPYPRPICSVPCSHSVSSWPCSPRPAPTMPRSPNSSTGISRKNSGATRRSPVARATATTTTNSTT